MNNMLVYLLQRLTNALMERMNVSTEQRVLTQMAVTSATVLLALLTSIARPVSILLFSSGAFRDKNLGERRGQKY